MKKYRFNASRNSSENGLTREQAKATAKERSNYEKYCVAFGYDDGEYSLYGYANGKLDGYWTLELRAAGIFRRYEIPVMQSPLP